MKLAIVIVLLCFLVLVTAQDDVNALVKAVFDVQSEKLVKELEKHALATKVPDIHKKIETFLADFALDFKHIKINKILMHKPLVSDKITIVSMKGCELHINLDWMYKQLSWPNVEDKGKADIQVSFDVQVDLTFALNNLKPDIKIKAAKVDIKKFDVKLSGGASWLYNTIIGIFKKPIQDALKKELEPEMSKTLVKKLGDLVSKSLTL